MSKKENTQLMLPDEVVMSKIYFIREEKVMLDRDLAVLYGVETKYLKRQVRRNMLRFPEDFMFELTEQEFKEWRSQFVTSKEDKMGLRYAPYAFTEIGIAQLSGVLNSEIAILINNQIMRVFIRMRKMLQSHGDIHNKLEKIDKKLAEQDDKILVIFEYLKKFEEEKQQKIEQQNRKRIGYKTNKED